MASSSEEEEEAPTQMPAAVPVKKPRMEKVHVVTPPPVDPDSGKEARLRRQRELQEQFRQRRAEAANRESSDSANSTASSSVVSRVVPNGSSFARDQGPLSTSSYSSANAPEKKERPTVVVSTSDVRRKMFAFVKNNVPQPGHIFIPGSQDSRAYIRAEAHP